MDGILSYHKKLEDDYYHILGCDELSTTEQIQCEYKLRALIQHPDKNSDDPDAAEKFRRLQRAKEVLLDDEMRKTYDKWRNSGISMPFDQWLNLSKSVHTNLHWVTKKRTDPMLQESPHASHGGDDHDAQIRHDESNAGLMGSTSYGSWQQESPNELLRKFRNYEI